MPDLHPLDRLRIELAVWNLDQRLYELPRRTRIAHRRELRANLLEAAADVGARAALRDVGNLAGLAEQYRDAAFGAGPRPSWTAAGAFLLTTTLVLTSMFFDAAKAFGDGIVAGNPAASGTFSWQGISRLQSEVVYTVAEGDHRFVGGAFTPLTWVLLVVGTVAVGRLWRALPGLRREVATPPDGGALST